MYFLHFFEEQDCTVPERCITVFNCSLLLMILRLGCSFYLPEKGKNNACLSCLPFIISVWFNGYILNFELKKLAKESQYMLNSI